LTGEKKYGKNKSNKTFYLTQKERITLLMHINDFYNLPDNSEHFNINLEKDTKAFIDPHKIRCGNSQRTLLYEDKINDFMETLVSLLKNDKYEEAIQLCNSLSECNFIHLGYCKSNPQGKGLGTITGKELCDSIIDSEAFSEDLLTHLEDFTIFIKQIGSDRISDICARIILFDLVDFTKETLDEYKVDTGFYWENTELVSWDLTSHQFIKKKCKIPVCENNKSPFILTPKEIISEEHVTYNGLADFVRHGILAYYINNYRNFPEILELAPKNKHGEVIHPSKKAIEEKKGGVNQIFDEFFEFSDDLKREIINLYKKIKK